VGNSTTPVNTGEPQVVIVLDNSQSMAEIVPNSGGNGKDGTSGLANEGIYTGSGLAQDSYGNAVNQSSSSPVNYPVNGYTPRVQAADSSGNAPYTVSCDSGALPSAYQTLCGELGSGSYLDNSESLINVAEQAIDYVITSPNAAHLNLGLVDYSVRGSASMFNSWVYYMSGVSQSGYGSGFDFGTSTAPTSAAIADGNTVVVNNPCYQSETNSCRAIANTNSQTGNNYGTANGYVSYRFSAIYNDPYMYVGQTSDNPDVVDILYASGLSSNVLTYGGGNLNNYSLPSYENLGSGNYDIPSSNYPESTDELTQTNPTSSGYVPSSQEVWYAERGYAFNNPVNGGYGNVVEALQPYSASVVQQIETDIAPEGFSFDTSQYPEIEPDAGFSPMAGALTTADEQFVSPSCAGKYVILITDGQPTMGTGGHTYPPVGSEAADALYLPKTSKQASYNANGSFISSQNNALTETIHQITAMSSNGIKTFVIGVGPAINGSSAEDQASLAALNAMAIAGGTNQVYNAASPSQVQNALNSIVAQIAGTVVTASAGASPSLNTGNNEYLLANNSTNGEGNLSAYDIAATGLASPTPSWNAESNMTTPARQSFLFSAGPRKSDGTTAAITPIAKLDSAAFGKLPGSLTPSIVADYTINPDYDSGAYLGGRNSNWLIGLTSQATPAVLSAPDNAYLLNIPSYLTYVGQNQGVKPSVLFSDNDGFLYSYGLTGTGSKQTGTFQWGFMPRGLVSQLSDYNSFWEGQNQGGFTTVDAYNAVSKAWGTYVVGLAQGGGILYGLQVTPNSSGYFQPSAEVYEDDLGASYYEPVQESPVIYQNDTTGVAYALYVVNTGTGSSESSSLYGFNVANPSDHFVDQLPFVATSQPTVDQFGNVYLGDNLGNVWEAPWSSVYKFSPENNFSNIGNYGASGTGAIDPIQYLQVATYNGLQYLVAEGSNRVTSFQNGTNGWSPIWTSYVGGSGIWKNGTFSGGTSAGPSFTAVQALQRGGSIDAAGAIFSGVVDIPVTVQSTGANSCNTYTAYNDFFNLATGYFPGAGLVPLGQNGAAQDLWVGTGTAFTPTISIFNGKLFVQTTASQNTLGQTALSKAFYAGELPVGGPVGWRELFQ
jgi:type IV pilus assembly protein PilY1